VFSTSKQAEYSTSRKNDDTKDEMFDLQDAREISA
jgi:hypothetical protein